MFVTGRGKCDPSPIRVLPPKRRGVSRTEEKSSDALPFSLSPSPIAGADSAPLGNPRRAGPKGATRLPNWAGRVTRR